MKVGFVTCVELGLSCMEVIYDLGGRLDVAVTLQDENAKQKSGRIYLDEFCVRHDLPLVKVGNINDEASVDTLGAYDLDWLFIIGWSQIAHQRILNLPRCGVLGMHPTLLPEGRGRASVPWAILKGLKKTGVSLFKLDSGVDSGPILLQEEILLTEVTTATDLYDAVNRSHRNLMHDVWAILRCGNVRFHIQDESNATYWDARKPADGEITSAMSRIEAEILVRAVTRPYPGAFFIENAKKLIIWRAHVADPDEPVDDRRVIELSDGMLICDEYEFA